MCQDLLCEEGAWLGGRAPTPGGELFFTCHLSTSDPQRGALWDALGSGMRAKFQRPPEYSTWAGVRTNWMLSELKRGALFCGWLERRAAARPF